jgi:Ni/Co efflux regulator RcnB
MMNKLMASAIAVLALSAAGAAMAQSDKDVRADQAGRERIYTPNHPPQDYGRPGYNRPGYRPPPRGMVHTYPGAGPEHNFYKGGRLPGEWRSRQYVVDDWRGHHLRRPPRGYYWVQTGGDYVLAAIATGIIADVIINH